MCGLTHQHWLYCPVIFPSRKLETFSKCSSAMGLSTVEPTQITLANAEEWACLSGTATVSLYEELGSPTLLREIGYIPDSAWVAAVAAWLIPPSPPPQTAPGSGLSADAESPAGEPAETRQPPLKTRPPRAVELGRAEALRRVARLALGMPGFAQTSVPVVVPPLLSCYSGECSCERPLRHVAPARKPPSSLPSH